MRVFRADGSQVYFSGAVELACVYILMGLPGHVSSALICAHVFLRPLLELTLEDGSGVNTLPAIPVMIDVIYAEQDSAEPIDASQGL